MIADIRLSVALVTRNRPDSLRRCLASLRAQSMQPCEVVVSDDSDDEFAASTRRVAGEFACRYVTGPKRGLYANRNSAVLQCTGTHIRTMDDDHTFSDGHFEQCLAAVRSDPGAIWTTGETGFIDGKAQGKSETATQLHSSGVGSPVENPDDNWAVADGSSTYPADVFRRGFRMVENLGYGSSYLEFGALLYHNGWRSRCVPGAWIEHHLDPSIPVRNDACSRLYASLCFNLFFRPDAFRFCKHLSVSVMRNPSLLFKMPGLISLARSRWSATSA